VYTDSNITEPNSNSSLINCIPGLIIPRTFQSTVFPSTAALPTGRPGDTGSTGGAGATGATGLSGPFGPPGNIGAPGSVGTQGNVGPRGDSGPKGAEGVDGIPGRVGEKGPLGFEGSQGSSGKQGYTGPRGLNGENVIVPFGGLTQKPRPDDSAQDVLAMTSDEDSSYWSSKDAIMGVFIWLAILSFILFVVMVTIGALCCLYHVAVRSKSVKQPQVK
jgi:hypothetical protein